MFVMGTGVIVGVDGAVDAHPPNNTMITNFQRWNRICAVLLTRVFVGILHAGMNVVQL
jgi:hypothetical protein